MKLLIKNILYKFFVLWIASFILLSYAVRLPDLAGMDWLRLMFGGTKMSYITVIIIYMCAMALLQYVHLDSTLLFTREGGILLSRLQSRKKLFRYYMRNMLLLNVLFCLCIATAGTAAVWTAKQQETSTADPTAWDKEPSETEKESTKISITEFENRMGENGLPELDKEVTDKNAFPTQGLTEETGRFFSSERAAAFSFPELLEVTARGFLFCVLFVLVQTIVLTYVEEAKAFLIMTGISASLAAVSGAKLAAMILPAPFALDGMFRMIAVVVCMVYIAVATAVCRRRLLKREIGIDGR